MKKLAITLSATPLSATPGCRLTFLHQYARNIRDAAMEKVRRQRKCERRDYRQLRLLLSGSKPGTSRSDGEAGVLGPDGSSRFEELRRREAADTAILYAFDLIEHDGEDMRNCPLLDRTAALARL
jgi:hypothetical protein